MQDPDPAINQGSSLLATIALAREKGYSLVCAAYWDALFVPDGLYPAFRIPDNGIDLMTTTRTWRRACSRASTARL